jgi:CheY-like chemotaxis protein
MDGLEATRKVRGHEAAAGAPRVPIVAVTAHALAEERARCEAAGMDLCLTKPLRAQELDDVLARYLGGDAEGSPAPSDAFEDSILEIVGGDRELLAAVAGEYLRQTPPLLRELSDAVERRDAPEVRRTAHKLRGSSLQVGGTRPGAAAGRLEDAARDGDLSAADTLLREITEGVEELTTALTSMVGETT